jgi:hypothetical protein
MDWDWIDVGKWDILQYREHSEWFDQFELASGRGWGFHC